MTLSDFLARPEFYQRIIDKFMEDHRVRMTALLRTEPAGRCTIAIPVRPCASVPDGEVHFVNPITGKVVGRIVGLPTEESEAIRWVSERCGP